MKYIPNVHGSQQSIRPIDVNIDTVYIRMNVKRIETEDFTGWQYDEIQYPLREYIETLIGQEDVGMLSLMVSMLMNEIDMIKSQIGGGQ